MATAPKGGATVVDVRDDGTSVFTQGLPQMDKDARDKSGSTFSDARPTVMEGGSVLTFHVTSIGTMGAGDGLTFELDLEEV